MKIFLATFFLVFASITYTSDAKADLLAYFDFEGNTLDSSGKNNHAVNSGATLGAGYSGQGFAFDGIDDFMTVNLDVNPSTLSDLSWGAWVNSSGATGIRKILSHDNGGFDRTLGLDTRPGAGTTWSTFTGSGVQGTAAVTPGSWQFVASVYDETSSTATLYVDGIASTYTSSFGSGFSSMRIGSNPGFGEYFSGLIDDVFIFDEALSIDQLDAIRQGGVNTAVPEPGTLLLLGSCMAGLAFRKTRKA